MKRRTVLKGCGTIVPVVLSLLTSGCGGVKFGPTPIDKPLPSGFAERTIYPDGAAAYEMEDLVGCILLEKNITESIVDPSTGQARVVTKKKYDKAGVVLPADFTPTVRPIKEALMYYRSKIDRGAAVQGSYLAFAASFSEKQLGELTLSDSALVSIPNSKFPEQEILNYVKSHPTVPAGYTARLWIRSVILTRRVYCQYTDISANASGVVGDTVGVKAGVYNKQTEDVGDVILGMDTHDIDRLARRIEGEAEMTQTKAEKARKEAEKAQVEAEAAQKEAETAQRGVEKAQREAATALRGVDKAKQEAETAQKGVEKARRESATAQREAAAAQGKAETAQRGVEEARSMLEKVAKTGAKSLAQGVLENARKEVEKAQLGAENTRKELQEAQLGAENTRKELEKAQRGAEIARKELAKAQHGAENAREEVEKAQQGADNARTKAERARMDALARLPVPPLPPSDRYESMARRWLTETRVSTCIEGKLE